MEAECGGLRWMSRVYETIFTQSCNSLAAKFGGRNALHDFRPHLDES